MIQASYKRSIMQRFMDESQIIEFDTKYQAAKVPTANNLGQEAYDDVLRRKKFDMLEQIATELDRLQVLLRDI